jgi:hypothetical protein
MKYEQVHRIAMPKEDPMAQATSLLTKEQWMARLQTWATERWGQERAEAIRAEIEATAEHLVAVAEYPLEMEQMPAFFMDEA